MIRTRTAFSILISLVFAVACSSPTPQTHIPSPAQQTPLPSLTASATSTPVKPVVVSSTLTAIPTITATPKRRLIDDYSIEYAFEDNPPVLPDGAVARLGSGIIADSAVSKDKRFLALAAGVGFYIYRLPSLELHRFIATPRLAEFVTFSPDSTTIRGGGLGFELPWRSSWDVVTGQRTSEISTPASNSWIIHDIAYSADGTFYIERGSDFGMRGENVRVDNLQTGNGFFTSIGVEEMALSPDSRALALAFSDGNLEVHNPYNVENSFDRIPIIQIQVPTTDHITGLAWSPDNAYLIVSAGNFVWLISAQTGEILHTFECADHVISARWSMDGSTVLIATNMQIFALDAQDYDDRWQANYHGEIFQVEQHRLILLSSDWQFTVLDIESGALVSQQLNQRPAVAADIAFSPNGTWIAFASPITGITFYDGRSYAYTKAKQWEFSTPNSLAWSPDSKVIAAGYTDMVGTWDVEGVNLVLWDVETLNLLDSWNAGANIVNVAWSLDGALLAVHTAGEDLLEYDDDTVTIYDITSHAPLARFSAITGCCDTSHLYWSADSQSLAVHGKFNVLWDRQSNQAIDTLGPVLWSPNGDMWWVDLAASQIRLLDNDNLILDFEKQLLGNDPFVPQALLVISPDHSRLANGSGWNGIIAIFDMQRGALQKLLFRHTAEVLDLDWSPDGSTLISSSRDGTILVWNASQ
jgi:WD40 repeat protein